MSAIDVALDWYAGQMKLTGRGGKWYKQAIAELTELRKDENRLKILAELLGSHGSKLKTIDDLRGFIDAAERDEAKGLLGRLLTSDELAELRKDRERLEWLIEQPVMEGNHKQQPSGNREYIFRHTRHDGLPVIFQEDTPREAIDAAMEADNADTTS